MGELEPAAAPTTPLTLLTGFLGSGKTTLLNNLLRSSDARLGVLVNDFGALDIDGQLVENVDEDTIRFSGGCMCCEVKDDVEQGVTRLLDRPDPPEHVLLEASGIADPFSLVAQLNALAPLVALDAIVTVVDAQGLLRTALPDAEADWTELVEDQIMAADLVILNKLDLVSAEHQDRAAAIVRRIVQRARIVPTTHAEVPAAFVLGLGGAANAAALPAVDRHRHHSFSTWSYATDEPLDVDRLRQAIAALPVTVIRGKGVLALAPQRDERMLLQLVGRSATLNPLGPWADHARRSELVLIGASDALDGVALTAAFDACRVGA